jgi:ribosome-associated protein
LKDLILKSLDDDKAENVVALNIAGKTTVADWMVIASGRSTRQVSAMADHLLEKLKESGHRASSEGKSVGDWVLVDAGDVIVHVFRPEIRELYQLERMWTFPDDDAEAKPKRKSRSKKAVAAEDAA